jgi:hypothetical protein
MILGITALAAILAQATAPAAVSGLLRAEAIEASLPVMARHAGVWCGVFRRYDGEGGLVETFPTEVSIRFPRDGASDYEQINRYSPEGRPPSVLATRGVFDRDRIRFDTPRIRGWAVDDRSDEKGRTVLLFFEFLDGSGSYFYESIQLSDDGDRRHRVAQYFTPDGTLLRRTLIDEVKQPATSPDRNQDDVRCEPAP